MVYNLRNDFDEAQGCENEIRKYRKKRLHEMMDLYGENRVNIENGTTVPQYMEYMLVGEYIMEELKENNEDDFSEVCKERRKNLAKVLRKNKV